MIDSIRYFYPGVHYILLLHMIYVLCVVITYERAIIFKSCYNAAQALE